MLWILVKTFLLIGLSFIFARWQLAFLGIDIPKVITDWTAGLAVLVGLVSFLIAFSLGVFWGERNAREPNDHY